MFKVQEPGLNALEYDDSNGSVKCSGRKSVQPEYSSTEDLVVCLAMPADLHTMTYDLFHVDTELTWMVYTN